MSELERPKNAATPKHWHSGNPVDFCGFEVRDIASGQLVAKVTEVGIAKISHTSVALPLEITALVVEGAQDLVAKRLGLKR